MESRKQLGRKSWKERFLLVMSDALDGTNTYQIVVRKDLLTKEQRNAFNEMNCAKHVTWTQTMVVVFDLGLSTITIMVSVRPSVRSGQVRLCLYLSSKYATGFLLVVSSSEDLFASYYRNIFAMSSCERCST